MRADALGPGWTIKGDRPGVVRSVERLGEGPVIQTSIPGARTYLDASGLLQHNTYKP
jgi:hypothetical protein